MACTQILLPTGPLLLRGWSLTFEGDMGDFRRKKISYRLISTEKILAKKYYTWRKKKFYPEKKKIFRGVWLWEKNLTARPLYVRKKNSITSGSGEKILFPLNHTNPPPPINVKWSALFLPQTRTSRSMLARRLLCSYCFSVPRLLCSLFLCS